MKKNINDLKNKKINFFSYKKFINSLLLKKIINLLGIGELGPIPILII